MLARLTRRPPRGDLRFPMCVRLHLIFLWPVPSLCFSLSVPPGLCYSSAGEIVKSRFTVTFADSPGQSNRIASSYVDKRFQGNRDGGRGGQGELCGVVGFITRTISGQTSATLLRLANDWMVFALRRAVEQVRR